MSDRFGEGSFVQGVPAARSCRWCKRAARSFCSWCAQSVCLKCGIIVNDHPGRAGEDRPARMICKHECRPGKGAA